MTQQEANQITQFIQGLVGGNTVEVEGKTVSNDKMCNEHGIALQWSEQPSKKTGKHYLFHRSEEGQMCFGRGYLAS